MIYTLDILSVHIILAVYKLNYKKTEYSLHHI